MQVECIKKEDGSYICTIDLCVELRMVICVLKLDAKH